LAIAHAVQAIIVDCETIVNPELAAIIGNNGQLVMASSPDD
jgi:hypothetical protein